MIILTFSMVKRPFQSPSSWVCSWHPHFWGWHPQNVQSCTRDKHSHTIIVCKIVWFNPQWVTGCNAPAFSNSQSRCIWRSVAELYSIKISQSVTNVVSRELNIYDNEVLIHIESKKSTQKHNFPIMQFIVLTAFEENVMSHF